MKAACLLGQVVFLFGFDGVMLAVATDLLMSVGVMMCSLFKLGPGRRRRVSMKKNRVALRRSCSALISFTDIPSTSVKGKSAGIVLVLSQLERLASRDRLVPLGVLP